MALDDNNQMEMMNMLMILERDHITNVTAGSECIDITGRVDVTGSDWVDVTGCDCIDVTERLDVAGSDLIDVTGRVDVTNDI